jgi:hypothetical protein
MPGSAELTTFVAARTASSNSSSRVAVTCISLICGVCPQLVPRLRSTASLSRTALEVAAKPRPNLRQRFKIRPVVFPLQQNRQRVRHLQMRPGGIAAERRRYHRP